MLDDILDSGGESERWSRLRAVLGSFEKGLKEVYNEADRSAKRRQFLHKGLTSIGVTCGALAVLAAILQLSPPKVFAIQVPEWMETVAAAAALIAVGCGIVITFQWGWLHKRHQAERCRLLKYSVMIDPATWSSDAPPEMRGLDQVQGLKKGHLKLWCTEISDFEPPDPFGHEIEAALLRDIISYYCERRLHAQIDYFRKRSAQHSLRDTLVRRVVPICFFFSILAALGHFAYERYAPHEVPDHVGVSLTVIAAALPVLGSAIRTFRSANEFSRNHLRYSAVANALEKLDKRLAYDREHPDTSRVFRHLWHCEKIMEEEHREWLRLMLDAEWYG
jgi:hypothetical protein